MNRPEALHASSLLCLSLRTVIGPRCKLADDQRVQDLPDVIVGVRRNGVLDRYAHVEKAALHLGKRNIRKKTS
jgi:hypothetical protein